MSNPPSIPGPPGPPSVSPTKLPLNDSVHLVTTSTSVLTLAGDNVIVWPATNPSAWNTTRLIDIVGAKVGMTPFSTCFDWRLQGSSEAGRAILYSDIHVGKDNETSCNSFVWATTDGMRWNKIRNTERQYNAARLCAVWAGSTHFLQAYQDEAHTAVLCDYQMTECKKFESGYEGDPDFDWFCNGVVQGGVHQVAVTYSKARGSFLGYQHLFNLTYIAEITETGTFTAHHIGNHDPFYGDLDRYVKAKECYLPNGEFGYKDGCVVSMQVVPIPRSKEVYVMFNNAGNLDFDPPNNVTLFRVDPTFTKWTLVHEWHHQYYSNEVRFVELRAVGNRGNTLFVTHSVYIEGNFYSRTYISLDAGKHFQELSVSPEEIAVVGSRWYGAFSGYIGHAPPCVIVGGHTVTTGVVTVFETKPCHRRYY
eukprot:TRINITY_DN114285_c0_g1_i1.p1 TRINITY_DN114285_c0_g1~~TRINITY_DN114285_c0_g1_i1.p1  ORF type:complete len:473 (-),score=19.87 TRINITY_DN114285_c0_g1_i1:28-1290(-)